MTLTQLISENPILTFILVCVTVNVLLLSWSRLMRHLNIRAEGWPPPHLDADGDFKDKKD